MMSSSSASAVGVIPNSPPVPYPFDSYRDRLEYELTVRQEPKQARMCGVGGKADRRPIDPPPIVQLRVVDPLQRSSSSTNQDGRQIARPSSPSVPSPSTTLESSPTPSVSTATTRDPSSVPDSSNSAIDSDSNAATPVPSAAATSYAQSYLQNPYYFMFACLAKPDDDTELHWLKDGRTRCTTGSVVSSLYHLKDSQHGNEDAGFFVFPDLSVRTEGSYRLKLSLYEVVGSNVRHCKSIFSAPFYVYTAKKFPGMEESTPLSCSLADQGIKIRIRKDIRVRKRPVAALLDPQPMSRSNNANVSVGQHTFGAQPQFNSTSVMSTSHFNGSATTTVSASGFSDVGFTTHPPSQQQQHTYASFPVPHPPYHQQYHPLAPPPGSTPASGPLQPLPPESQPGWADAGAGSADTAGARGLRSRSPTSRSAASDEDDRRTDQSGPSDPATTGSEDSHEESELGVGMDVDDALHATGDDKGSDDEPDASRPGSSSGGRLTRIGRGRSDSVRDNVTKARDREERRKGREMHKLRLKSSSSSSSNPTSSLSSTRQDPKRPRTDSYQQPQYHQPIAPAPWAPAPQPPLSATSSSSASNSSTASDISTIGGSGVPAPIIDPLLNGALIGGLPPGVRIPPPPGAIIAPGAPSNVTGASRSGTATPIGTNSSATGGSSGRIPPPPGATIESLTSTTTNNGSGPSSTNNAVDSDGSAQGSAPPAGGSSASSPVYQHQHAPYEQPHAHQPPMSGPPPPAYSVQAQPAQMTTLPPPHPGNPTQYPSHVSHPSQTQAPRHPLPPPPPHSHPGPTPYSTYRQPPMHTHPQYSYSAPPHASYNAGPLPAPAMAPPTPQGYAGYPAWGVNTNQQHQHQQLLPQDQYQQPVPMQQLQYQQPGYGFPPPPPAQVRPYDYGQSLQPQHQAQHMYAPYAPAPYGYYDPAQQQPGAPPQQLQQSPFPTGGYGGVVGTPSPNAISAAPVPVAPPLLGPGQPGQQSTTPPNATGSSGGYVDYGSSSYASQPPPAPPRPGSPRAFQPQSQQYGYPNQLPPPPPHHHQYPQHAQPHPGPPALYPPPYGYMPYGNSNSNSNSGNSSLPNTPGAASFAGTNGAVGADMWGGATVAPSSGVPASWEAAPLSSTYPATAPASSVPYSQQSHSGIQLGSPGDRIQLAPMRQLSSGSENSAIYPNIIQLRSSSRSSRDEGQERSGSGVANISSAGRERDRDRGRDRERDVSYSRRDRERDRDDRTRNSDKDKERESRDRERERERDERGTKKNPLAIGNIIESGP